MLSVIHP